MSLSSWAGGDPKPSQAGGKSQDWQGCLHVFQWGYGGGQPSKHLPNCSSLTEGEESAQSRPRQGQSQGALIPHSVVYRPFTLPGEPHPSLVACTQDPLLRLGMEREGVRLEVRG